MVSGREHDRLRGIVAALGVAVTQIIAGLPEDRRAALAAGLEARDSQAERGDYFAMGMVAALQRLTEVARNPSTVDRIVN